jgi:hypothetical protein
VPAQALPPGVRPTQMALDALYTRLDAGRASLSATLNSGLDEAQTRDLLTTRDMRQAIRLVLKGLAARFAFESLPA